MLVSVGLNQRGAAISERERLALPQEELDAILAGYAALDGVDEVAALATCDRVEVFAATAWPAAAGLAVRRALCARAGRDLPLCELHGEDAFRHLVRVAAGLESAVLGEPQILGRVKEAFRRAVEVGAAGRELTTVVGRALQIARRVRIGSPLGRSGLSWGHAAAALAEKVLGPLSGRRVAVIGAGELARACGRHLRAKGATIAVLNRTLANAETLAREVEGTALPLEALGAELARADVLVCAAPFTPAAFTPGEMARLARSRRRRLVVVDLAVPRAVPAETGAVEDVYLCDVDDLDRVVRAGLAERAREVARAESILEEELVRRGRDELERRAAPLIREMRTRASAIAREEVERALRRLGEDPEIARRLDAMAGSIVSRILHRPSAKLREAAAGGEEGAALVAAAVEIFGLGHRPPTQRISAP